MWGIQKDTVYELRVMGYSRGGDGKMSHASFFTLGIMFFLFIFSQYLLVSLTMTLNDYVVSLSLMCKYIYFLKSI